jgi:hypothetical protein
VEIVGGGAEEDLPSAKGALGETPARVRALSSIFTSETSPFLS